MKEKKNIIIISAVWIFIAIALIYFGFTFYKEKNKKDENVVVQKNEIEVEVVTEENAIAQFNNKYYLTIQKAVDDVESDNHEKCNCFKG